MVLFVLLLSYKVHVVFVLWNYTFKCWFFFFWIYLQRNWCIGCVCVFLQFASTVLGEHFEKPSLHVWRSCDGSGRRLSVCHRPDLHGCLHQEWAQTYPGEQQRLMMYFINPIMSSWLSVSCSLSWSLFHRSPPATNCFMQRKSPLTRRWLMSRFLFCSTVCTYIITEKVTMFSLLFSYYKGVRQMVPVSDQDMNTHLAEISRVCLFYSILFYCNFYFYFIYFFNIYFFTFLFNVMSILFLLDFVIFIFYIFFVVLFLLFSVFIFILCNFYFVLCCILSILYLIELFYFYYYIFCHFIYFFYIFYFLFYFWYFVILYTFIFHFYFIFIYFFILTFFIQFI